MQSKYNIYFENKYNKIYTTQVLSSQYIYFLLLKFCLDFIKVLILRLNRLAILILLHKDIS